MSPADQKNDHFRIWRIDLGKQTLTREEVPVKWDKLGGRGLSARILFDELQPTCHPLGPGSKLIFAPGLMVGHMLSSCDRISIGGKSPLTEGIKEANAGGSTGLQLAAMGIKALVLEGHPQNEDWWVLHLSKEGARFDPAGDLVGLGVYDSAIILQERYGKKAAVSLIGPGGEMRLASAGIQNLDKDGVPSRIAARGGLGAVMGSKRLKAIVFDSSGYDKPPLVDPAAFKAAQKVFNKALMDHPQTATYRDYGTAAMARMADSFGALPTRNFSSGVFSRVEQISGEFMRDLLIQRGGESETTHACMAGCTIRCSNVFGGEDGKAIVSPLEYETIGLMGSNLEIGNLDSIARLNYQANDLGLDTIELGAALGVAAEAGLMPFGDGDAALGLVEEIRKGTPLGRMLGGGATLTGQVLGVERVPAVKGQAMSAYEPRAIKGTGVTYATSPQGADHTCGLTIRAKVNHLDPKGQADLSRTAQINMAGYDTLGACIFSSFGFINAGDAIRDLLNARYGWEVGSDILQVLGRECLSIEREFNRKAGFTPQDDRLPEWLTREPLPPHNTVFDVPDEDLDGLFNW
jgi:aldehyde:ferredoxin oxidoreductase